MHFIKKCDSSVKAPCKYEKAPAPPNLHKDFYLNIAARHTTQCRILARRELAGTHADTERDGGMQSFKQALPRSHTAPLSPTLKFCVQDTHTRARKHTCTLRLCSLSCYKYWTVFSFKVGWIIYGTPSMEEKKLFFFSFSFPWTAVAWLCVFLPFVFLLRVCVRVCWREPADR